MDNRILGLLAFMLVMAPAMAATVTPSTTYGCSGDSITLTGAGFGATNLTNFTYGGSLFSSSTIALTACTTGVWTNASHVTTAAGGTFVCTGTIGTNGHGVKTIAATDAVSVSGTTTFTQKCYAVTDLVSQGVDIAGKFMNTLVDQSGNIAALIILGLLVTLLVGIIAAVGAIFVVFKLK